MLLHAYEACIVILDPNQQLFVSSSGERFYPGQQQSTEAPLFSPLCEHPLITATLKLRTSSTGRNLDCYEVRDQWTLWALLCRPSVTGITADDKK